MRTKCSLKAKYWRVERVCTNGFAQFGAAINVSDSMFMSKCIHFYFQISLYVYIGMRVKSCVWCCLLFYVFSTNGVHPFYIIYNTYNILLIECDRHIFYNTQLFNFHVFLSRKKPDHGENRQIDSIIIIIIIDIIISYIPARASEAVAKAYICQSKCRKNAYKNWLR